uniref:Capsid n=1 Tax=viral metagenome TaxID=1070528 RepID=A0A2V0RBE5_9ZZZZ
MSSFNRATIKDDTEKYVGDLCTLIANPYQKSVSGKMTAPSSTSGASIYVAEGSGTVSCAAGTRSAVVVYDAEASLRRGQPAVLIFQRDSTDAVTVVSKINIGRPSTDFLSGGVISSTLTCANTSSLDDIAGSQTQAVLYSVPKGVSDLTATDVLQFTSDKDMHLVSNISSKADKTRTYGITEHNGSNSALLRDNARSNLVEIEHNVTASTQASQGFIAPAVNLAATTGSFLTNIANALFYSKRDTTKSPFSLASYVGHLSINTELLVSSSAAFAEGTLICIAMDAAGVVLDSVDVSINITNATDLVQNEKFDFALDVNLTSATVPIDSVAVFVKASGSAVLQRSTGVTSGRVSATEETADIPGRPIHFTVFEGLNPSASINVHGANILSGTPDSANAFISGGGGAGEDVYDYSMVNNMLLTFKHTFPRAYTGMGADIAAMALREWFELEGMSIAMEAKSFKRIGKAFKKLIKGAKQARSTASKIADVAQPIMQEGGMILASGAFGPTAQVAGAGMLAGAEGIEQSRRYGVLE